MRYVEDGSYNCTMFGCYNKARHSQKTTKGTVILCSDCLGELWGMSPLGIERLKEVVE